MSSPLKAFRKHQKALIVIFGVLLMVSFTVLASVQQYFQPKPPGQDEGERVVATWKGTDITRDDLNSLRFVAVTAYQFLDVLAKEAEKGGGSPQVKTRLEDGVALAMGEKLRELADKGVEDVDFTDMQLAYQIILADKAEEMGIVISDETVTRYFAKVCDDSLRTSQQFEALFAREFGSGKVNYKGVLAFMRQMLLAQNMYEMGVSGLETVSPGEAKTYHDRIYRKKLVEFLPVKVADYLPRVTKQPSQSELDKLYQQGKDVYATREPSNAFQTRRENRGAAPGFRQRYQIQLAYFKGDVDEFRKLEEAKITDEQIAQYYEEHKEDYKNASLLDGDSTDDAGPGVKPIGLPSLDGPLSPDDKDDSPTNKSDGAAKKEDVNPADQPDKATGQSPQKAGEEDKSDQPQGTKPDAVNSPQPGEKQSGSDTDAAKSVDDQSSLETRDNNSTVFVSLDDQADAGDAAADGKETDSSNPSVGSAKENAAGAAKADPQEPASAAPAETGSETGDDKDSKPEVVKNPAGETESDGTVSGETTGESDKPKPKYKSLDEVKDQIRGVLAREAVVERYEDKGDSFNKDAPFRYLRDQALDNVSRTLLTFSRAHNRWTQSKRQGSKAKEPKPIDWNAVAADHHLTYGKTEFVDQFQLAESEMATVADGEFQQFAEIFKAQLVQDAFDEQRKPYQASKFPPGGNVVFLYWKVADREEYTPPKEKILEQVKKAWRLQEARKLALADAEKNAASVTDGKTLEEVFGKEAIVKPNFFSWLSLGSMGRRLDFSKVDGVDSPGERFHKDVAKLKEGQVGIARNDAETEIYVVRVIRDIVFTKFTEITPQIANLAQLDRLGAYQDWLDDVSREMEVEWQVAEAEEE